MELLEIAKASPAKSLGIANPDLPDGLRTVPIVKETNCATAVLYATKFEEQKPQTALRGGQQEPVSQTQRQGLPKRLLP